MSLLTHQSFANTDTPYWASASKPTSLVSPLSVVDAYGVPTKKTVVQSTSGGAGSIYVANENNGNPVGMTMQQGATQPLNTVSFDLGNVNPVLSLSTSNVVSTQPIVLDTAVNAESLVISQSASSSILQTGGGCAITLSNTGGPVKVGDSIFLYGVSGGNVLAQNNTGTANGQLDWNSLTFSSAGSVAGTLGAFGTSMYLNTGLAGAGTGGLIVNKWNGCELAFNDGTATLYGMSNDGTGNLVISAPSSANAIKVSPSGQVSIPDIVSGSFVPIGGIVMFSGSVGTLPPNWKVCDGTGGTPNLQDRFILGSGTFAIGDIGGSNLISISNLPSHGHSIADLTHSHTVYAPSSYDTFGRVGGTTNFAKDGATLTTSSVLTGINKTDVVITSDPSGTVATIGQPYYPSYYVLAYIMRMA